MNPAWRSVRLEEVTNEITVGHVGPMASEYVPEGIPFLRSQNVERLFINSRDLRFISPEFNARLPKSSLRSGDVVIVRTGKPGTCAVVSPALAGANCSDLVIIRCGPTLDPRYLAYFINSAATQHIDAHLVGAVQQHFNVGAARAIRMDLPPLAQQRAIARILGALDDKIELNRRTNETLEAMARALFQSWFVDFDPVRAKMEGRQPEGMDAETAELFPESFTHSELGLVPDGWRLASLGDEASLVAMGPFGSDIRVDTFVDAGIPVISGKHLHGTLLDDCGYNFISSEHAARLSKCNVFRGDVVFTHAGTIGQVAYIPETSQYDRYVISQRQFFMRCRPGSLPATYIVYYFKSDEGRHRLLANTSSTGVPSIARPVTYLRSLKLVVPAHQVLQAYDKTVRLMHRSIGRGVGEIACLTALRDTLLPKLLSGELRVPEAEKAVSAVL